MSSQEYQFNFDMKKMEEAINSPSISVPKGLDIEQFRDWINTVVDESDAKQKYLDNIKVSCPKCQSEHMELLAIYLSSDPKISKWKCRECHTKIEITN